MLKLLLGTDWVANRNAILDAIACDVKSRQDKRILIVPELISHDMERRLCAVAGDTASRYAQVLTFTRLASRVADSVGHRAKECMDEGGRVVAMAAAVRQAQSRQATETTTTPTLRIRPETNAEKVGRSAQVARPTSVYIKTVILVGRSDEFSSPYRSIEV